MHPNIFLFNKARKGIGKGNVYPQNQKMTDGYDYNSYNSVWLLRPWEFPNFEPNFDSLLIQNGTILTDYISSVPIPYYVMIVSKKLLNILLSFKILPYRIYKVTLIHKNEEIKDYYGLHLIENKNHYEDINYNRSTFWVSEYITHKKVHEINISSASDLNEKITKLSKQNQNLGIWAENLIMQDDFYKKSDMFCFTKITFPVSFYVTDIIKLEIEKQKCTGVDFQCVSNTRDEIKDYFGDDTYTYFP